MTSKAASSDQRYYRLDRFLVPATAREEVVTRVLQTHEVLRKQPGFIRDLLLDRGLENGAFGIVTLAEWESEDFVAGARAAVQAMHRASNFDPQELFRRLGIEPDLGNYRQLVEEPG